MKKLFFCSNIFLSAVVFTHCTKYHQEASLAHEAQGLIATTGTDDEDSDDEDGDKVKSKSRPTTLTLSRQDSQKLANITCEEIVTAIQEAKTPQKAVHQIYLALSNAQPQLNSVPHILTPPLSPSSQSAINKAASSPKNVSNEESNLLLTPPTSPPTVENDKEIRKKSLLLSSSSAITPVVTLDGPPTFTFNLSSATNVSGASCTESQNIVSTSENQSSEAVAKIIAARLREIGDQYNEDNNIADNFILSTDSLQEFIFSIFPALRTCAQSLKDVAQHLRNILQHCSLPASMKTYLQSIGVGTPDES